MMHIRKLLVVVGLVAVLTVGLLAGRQLEKMGNPDSTGDPASTSSYTLEDIYNRLDTGLPGSPSTFTEPTSDPGTGTMHTLNEIMALIPDLGSNVAGGDGEISFGIPDGIYRSKTATAKDSDLKAEDIRDGVQIFNVTGTNLTCVQCNPPGTLDGTRWCDNLDGTVTDMTTGLVWLKDASWGGQKPWRNDSLDCGGPDYTCYDDAHARAGLLCAGAAGAGLSDGSVEGDWRLPTLEELKVLTTGTEAVSYAYMRAFSGVQPTCYWSSTTRAYDTSDAWVVDMNEGIVIYVTKSINYDYVWPVRGG